MIHVPTWLLWLLAFIVGPPLLGYVTVRVTFALWKRKEGPA